MPENVDSVSVSERECATCSGPDGEVKKLDVRFKQGMVPPDIPLNVCACPDILKRIPYLTGSIED